MKTFLDWFKASTKVKRWILLIIIGIVLTCYGIAKIIVSEEISFFELGKIVAIFVVGFVSIVISVVFIQKRTLELIIEANHPETDAGKNAQSKIKSLIFNKKVYEEGPNIVILGGGHGLNTIISGFKKYSNNITSIVTMSEYGNDPTISRLALGSLPFNDIKDSIIAMSENEASMEKLMNWTFKNDRIRGITFSDIYLTAMNEIYNNNTEAVLKSSEVLNITGRVLPVTLDEITICAELADGTVVKQKNRIPDVVAEKVERISRIYVTPSNCRPAPGVLEAIENADVIIVGPGSLYTNVLPPLLIKNVARAIKESKAFKYYISNIMTEPGQTEEFKLSDHLKTIHEHIGIDIFDYCIADTGEIVPEFIRKYNKEGAEPVEVDINNSEKYNLKVIQKDMSCIKNDKIRHNADVVASIVIEMLCNDLKFHDLQNNTEYLLLQSVLKEQKKIQAREAKRSKSTALVETKAKHNTLMKRDSRFKTKYRERVESIQNSDATTIENKRNAKELEKKKNH